MVQESRIDLDAVARLTVTPQVLPDTAEIGLMLQGAAGQILSANPVAERILGAALDLMQGHTPADAGWRVIDEFGLVVPADRHPSMVALATGQPTTATVLGVRRATSDAWDSHLWITVSCHPVRHPGEPRPYAVLVAFTEVEGLQAELLTLRESERNYRLLAERSDDLIAVLDLDFVRVWVSPSYERITGYTPQELLGVSVLDHLHPDDAARIAAADAARRLHGKVERPVRLQCKDGRWIWIEPRSTLVTDDAGRPMKVHLASRVVTKRVEAEQARDRALEELATLVEHAPIPSGAVDPHGRWVRVNQALCELLGYPAERLLAMTFLEVSHRDDLPDCIARFDQLLSGEIEQDRAEKRFLTSEGRTVWVLRTARRLPVPHGSQPQVIVQMLDITEQKRAQETLHQLAVSDPLTGLSNRLVLNDRLTHALAVARRKGLQVGVVFIDLDGFKQVNDTRGHEVGDQLLQEVAARLRRCVREEDTVVRLGGDEFVVVCEEIAQPDVVHRLAGRIAEALHRPYLLEDGEARVSTSIGVALADGPDVLAVLQQADTSMYRAKKAGGARIDSLNAAEQAAAVQHLALQREIRNALPLRQFVVHYQPIAHLPDGAQVGFEALLRWAHPERGLIGPDAFLPAAERSPFIVDLDTWVLGEACQAAVGWSTDATVAVNISARHFSAEGFVDSVSAALSRSGLAPQRLMLEITESVVLSASPSTVRVALSLHHLGVRLALDDFGTGQSSITALHRLPIHTLKIDRSFVADLPGKPQGAALVRGLINLGAGLGLEVVAEGVETPEQAEWLTAEGCRFAQGFLFGRPSAMALAPESAQRAQG